MVTLSEVNYCDDDIERNAYNAAFYDLGLRFHWDAGTHEQLLAHSPDAAERICHYLKAYQPHLLRAYEGESLVALILQKKDDHRRRCAAAGPATARHFNWAEATGREVGA